MLVIKLGGERLFNRDTERFMTVKPTTVRLEHSLISVSKWESIWEKPFLMDSSDDPHTREQLESYIQCMIIGDVADGILSILTTSYNKQISDYIYSKSSATTIKKNDSGPKGAKSYVTSELIYYWMVEFNIPFKTETWHLNRLLTLIDICNIKREESNPKSKKKYNRQALLANRKSLNNRRRSQLGTKG